MTTGDRRPEQKSWFSKSGNALILGCGLLLLQACAAKQQPEPEELKPAAAESAERVRSLDGRLQADAHEYPWSALGRVNIAGVGFCNGIMVGPRQVLTQAQCLYSERDRRWWQPGELHFIAAYQRDRFLADSKVARFFTAPGYNPAGGISLANLTNNWAVVILREPIGARTGWLGLQWENNALTTAEARGDAVFLRAGYRIDWQHSISLHFGCKAGGTGLINLCEATPSELALPPFVISGGALHVVADYFVRTAGGSALASRAAMTQQGNLMGRASPPTTGGPVRRNPTASATAFLTALGYGMAEQDLSDAMRLYLQDQNLPNRDTADISFLASLLVTAQNTPAR